MLIVAAYTAVVAAIEIHFLRDLRMSESGEAVEKVLKNTTIMHSILGFVLSLLVVFRTNTASTDGGKAESCGAHSSTTPEIWL